MADEWHELLVAAWRANDTGEYREAAIVADQGSDAARHMHLLLGKRPVPDAGEAAFTSVHDAKSPFSSGSTV
jgi:protocatechuate 3,4-dioxygenase beta subunit